MGRSQTGRISFNFVSLIKACRAKASPKPCPAIDRCGTLSAVASSLCRHRASARALVFGERSLGCRSVFSGSCRHHIILLMLPSGRTPSGLSLRSSPSRSARLGQPLPTFFERRSSRPLPGLRPSVQAGRSFLCALRREGGCGAEIPAAQR